ncbi:hypothetical protein GGR55DRAFT_138129 [Xylaria sp. FL0064]|nr:hypothetical protein GGR55DRAFT_138129 [Xylaria sp. FL0064]
MFILALCSIALKSTTVDLLYVLYLLPSSRRRAPPNFVYYVGIQVRLASCCQRGSGIKGGHVRCGTGILSSPQNGVPSFLSIGQCVLGAWTPEQGSYADKALS